MDLFLEPGLRRATARQLYDQLREAIASGRLRAGDRLPPTRQLATELGIARQTVSTVYGQLAAEGFTHGMAGAGTFVAAPDTRRRRPGQARPLRIVSRPATERHDNHQDGEALYDLQCGVPDLALFPVAEWRRAMAPVLRQPPAPHPEPAGSPSLRNVIAHWIGRSRGVETAPDDVLVTSGAHQAIDLVGRVLLRPGDTVAVEDPAYPDVRQIFASLGAKVVPVRRRRDGIRVGDVPTNARVVHVTPSHQFPLGVAMSLERRRALLQLAQRHNIAVIEDDYDSEFRHVDRPLEPLHRLDRTERVIYVASFSKVLAPSLRLGFVVLPPSITDAVVALRRVVDPKPSALLQDALEAFIVNGALDRHLRRARRVYRERHQLVTSFLRRETVMAHAAAFPAHAGLHVSATLSDVDERRVIEEAGRRGVRVDGLRRTYAGPGRDGLMIGFGAVSTGDLPAALDAVAAAIEVAAASSVA